MKNWRRFDSIRPSHAAERLAGVTRRTPLQAFDAGNGAIELRLKLECLQETGSFKARGAWNQISRLSEVERGAGVIATSSGNHGQALAWAAHRAGVAATIVMPADAYPNKIQACRDHGAEVVLAPTRVEAERICEERVRSGAILIHPFDSERTVQGAGTVGLEIAEDWPEVEVCIVPVGGGGLLGGSSLALRQELGEGVVILAAEPRGAATMSRGLEMGEPVLLEEIDTQVQGLCPLSAGHLNVAICLETVDGVLVLEDEEVFEAQGRLVRAGIRAEPAGAAAPAIALLGRIPSDLTRGRDVRDPLRVAAVVSGGNADPAQLERLLGAS